MEIARQADGYGKQIEWRLLMKRLRLKIDDEWYDIEVGDTYQSPVEVIVDGESFSVEIGTPTDGVMPQRRNQAPKAELPGLRGESKGDENVIRCPLPGKIVSISVEKGQSLEIGDEICKLESMKMEQSVRMGKPGKVKNIKVKKDQTINAGQPLIEIQ